MDNPLIKLQRMESLNYKVLDVFKKRGRRVYQITTENLVLKKKCNCKFIILSP